jgi:hypothetical protein
MPEREIISQQGKAGVCKRGRESAKQRRITIRSGAVCQRDAVTGCGSGPVQEAASLQYQSPAGNRK